MRTRRPRLCPSRVSLLVVATFGWAASAAWAQHLPYPTPSPGVCPPLPCPIPGMPPAPQAPRAEPQPAPTTPTTPTAPPTLEPTLPTEQAAATGTGEVALAAPSVLGNLPGYIDAPSP